MKPLIVGIVIYLYMIYRCPIVFIIVIIDFRLSHETIFYTEPPEKN